eukprot:scaffold35604_cov29-Attheya_sp.AAC.2
MQTGLLFVVRLDLFGVLGVVLRSLVSLSVDISLWGAVGDVGDRGAISVASTWLMLVACGMVGICLQCGLYHSSRGWFGGSRVPVVSFSMCRGWFET